jgi:hypothetical protein
VIGVLASDIHGKVDGAAGGKLAGLLAALGVAILTTVPPANYTEVRGSSLLALSMLAPPWRSCWANSYAHNACLPTIAGAQYRQ